jgi:hypothetical protein
MPVFTCHKIGDYAVFGSRSTLIGTGAHERGSISIGSGAMLADRCCMMFNSSLGFKTVMVGPLRHSLFFVVAA